MVGTIVVCESRSNAGRKQAFWGGRTIRAAGDRGTVTGHGVRVQGCGQRHGQSASSGGRVNGTETGDGGRGFEDGAERRSAGGWKKGMREDFGNILDLEVDDT